MKVSIPLLAVVQEVPRANRGRNAFQEYDHESLFSTCTKEVLLLDDPGRFEQEFDRALTIATSGRPGPVAILLPVDVLAAESEAEPTGSTGGAAFPLDRQRPAADRVTEAAKLIAEAERPVMIAGGGVHVSGAADAVADFQKRFDIPVGTTTMGKGSVDENHELSLGIISTFMGRNSLNRSQGEIVSEADLILLVGTRTNENGTAAWSLYPEDATFIHLDQAPEEIGRNYGSVRLAGDALAGLEDLTAELAGLDLTRRKDARFSLAERIAAGRAADSQAAAEVTQSDSSPIRPERVMSELDRLLESTDIVAADASYSTIWIAAYLKARAPGQRFITPRGLAGLGWGLPLAIGAQVASPDARVVCVVGDGGFGHAWSELETLAREGLPVTVIVLNNSILGFQKHAEVRTWGAHTSAVHFNEVDHAAIAEACGVTAERISDPGRLAEALESALASREPNLIEVVTDSVAHPPITGWD
jgi:acetolactate synthase-1/2/3 large subunit